MGDSLEACLYAHKEGFGLGAPLVSLGIVRDPERGLCFVHSAHHASYDGWSHNKVFEAVEAIYRNDQVPYTPNASYSSFVRWTTEIDEDICANYWRNYLADAPGPIFPPPPSLMAVLELGG